MRQPALSVTLTLAVLLGPTCAPRPARGGAPEAPALPAGCLATTAALSPSPLFAAGDARIEGPALVVVLKGARRAMVFGDGALREVGGAPACWRVALGVDAAGEHPPGPKRRRGDRKTPEGWYRTSDKPSSSFAPAMAIHYPNAADARAGLAAGLVSEAEVQAIEAAMAARRKPPQDTRLGGELLFHGGGSAWDWTWGCVALDDADNAALRSALPPGLRTDVLILP